MGSLSVEESRLPIIIAGTGLSALLLAHALLGATPTLPFHLYERDLSMTHRAQGYRIKVTGRGVKSCREVLASEHMELLRATCGDNLILGAKKIEALTGVALAGWGGVQKHMNEEPLTADRTMMRQVLFKGLEGYTTFGKEVVGYDNEDDIAIDGNVSGNGNVTVSFADGSRVRGALLVGADGAFSRVRAQLSPEVQLLDSEVRMVLGRTPVTPAFYAALGHSGDNDPELLSGLTLLVPPPEGGPFFMFEPMRFGRRAEAATTDPVLATSIPNDYIYWGFAMRSDQREAQGRDWRSMPPSAVADLAENMTRSWLPSLRPLVSHQDRKHTIPLRSSIMPVPAPTVQQSTRATIPMVTLIGDAAHAMPPTGGIGATTALTDAAVLGAALATHGVSRRALEAYEIEMREYASQAIEMSLQGGKKFINMQNLDEMKPMEH